MAQRGRTKKEESVVREVYAQTKDRFGFPDSLQLVWHDDSRVSLLQVDSTGITPVVDRVSGNAFVDGLALMSRLVPLASKL